MSTDVRTRSLLVLLILALLPAARPAFAQTRVWNAAVSGNWSDPSKWNPAGVPIATDVVGIQASGTYTVTLDVDAVAIAGLIVGGGTGTQALVVTNKTLAVDGDATVEIGGELGLTGGTVALSSAAATMRVRGLLRARAASALTGSAAFANEASGTVRVEGSTAGAATLTIPAGFTNAGRIELTNTAGAQAATFAVTAGTLTNAPGGVIQALTGVNSGGRTLAAQLDNQGLISSALATSAALTIAKSAADHLNSGTIQLLGGGLALNQTGATPSFVNSGTIDAAAGQDLTISGGSFENTGTITIGAGRKLAVANAAFRQLAGTLAASGGILELTSTSTATLATDLNTTSLALVLSGSTVDGTGTITNDGTITLNSATISAPVVQGSGGVIEARAYSALGGSFGGNPSGGTIRILGSINGGGTLTFAQGFTNAGLIELTNAAANQAATINVTAGTLTNAAGGIIDVLTGAGGGARTVAAQLDNQGLLRINLPTSGTFTLAKASADHQNSGTIRVLSGSLTLNQTGTTPSFVNPGTIDGATGQDFTIAGGSFENTGTITLGPGRTLSVANAAFRQLAGTLAGNAGTLELTSAATATFATDLNTTSLALVLSGSTVDGTGTITNDGTITLFSSTINAPVVQGGTGVIEARTNSALGGSFSGNPSGATIRILGSINGGGTLTFAQGFTNAGLIELTNAAANQAATISVTAGTLTNAAGGSIDVLTGAGGGARTIAAQLDNQGLLRINLPVSGSFTLAKASADHQNSGTIRMLSGNLTLNQTGTTPSFVNSGTIDGAAGQDFTISGGSFENTGTMTIGSGHKLSVTTGVFRQLAGTLAGNGGTLELTSAATATFATDLNTSSLALVVFGSTVDGTGVISNDGTITLNSATINAPVVQDSAGVMEARANCALGGYFSGNPYGGTIRVLGSVNGSGTLTFAQGFTNAGLIELNNVAGSQVTVLNVTDGTLVNTGIIDVLPGTGGSRTLGAELRNEGLVRTSLTAPYALTLQKAGAHHVNAGTIDLVGGLLNVNQSGTEPTFSNPGTLRVAAGTTATISSGALANFDQQTLTGGTYDIAGTFKFPEADIVTTAAQIFLDGPESRITDALGNDGLRNFAVVTEAGGLTLKNGRNLSRPVTITSAGQVGLEGGSTLAVTGTGNDFRQTAGSTLLDGGALLVADSIDVRGGGFAGTGQLTGIVVNAGEVHPGLLSSLEGKSGEGGGPREAGEMLVTGSYAQTASGRLVIELGGPGAGECDRLAVDGPGLLEGTLELRFLNGYPGLVGDTLEVVSCAARAGEFDSLETPLCDPGECPELLYGPVSVRIVGHVPDPAGISDEPPPSDPGTPEPIAPGHPTAMALWAKGGLAPALRLDLPEAAEVSVRLFDALGRARVTLQDGPLAAGTHELRWNRRETGAGVYFARAEVRGSGRPVVRQARLVIVQ